MRSVFSLIIISVLFASCGQDNGHSNPPPNAIENNGGSDSDLGSRPSVSTKKASDDEALPTEISNETLLLDSMANADACNAGNERQLIYVVEENQFYYCAKTREWLPIDLKGPKGDQGVAGRDGKDGRDGRDGSAGSTGIQGVAGRDGRDGRDGETANSQIWTHPISEKQWFLANSMPLLSYAGFKRQLCPEGSHSPSTSEYTSALTAGLWAFFGPIITSVDMGTAVGATIEKWFVLGQIENGNYYDLILGRQNDTTVMPWSVATAKVAFSICIKD